MMKKRKKGFLGVLLSLAMIVTMLPTAVFAANGPCEGGAACTHAAAIGNNHYDTVNAAIEAAKTGDEIVLLKDVEEVLSIAKSDVNFTLNLNGKVVDATKVDSFDIVKIYGSNLGLTIKNGKLLNSSADAYGIYAYASKKGVYENLNLVIDNVTIDTGDQTLGVNGTNKNQNITVNNSIIKSKTTAIYFPPVTGKLVIKDTKITGVNNGIVVKGGEIAVEGKSEITVTGERGDIKDPYLGSTSGTNFPKSGSAIFIQGGYKDGQSGERPIKVVVSDGTFNSLHGAAVEANTIKDKNKQGGLVSGGEFTSAINLADSVLDGNAGVATLTGSDAKATYFVGNKQQLSSKLVSRAKAGDKINVQKGSADLSGLPNGVTVSKDEKAGSVVINVDGKPFEITDAGKPVVSHTHIWGEPVWTWSKDNSEATAKFVCKDDNNHVESKTVKSKAVVTDATCEKAGKIEYTATVEFDGVTYTGIKAVAVDAKGHTLKHVPAKVATEKEAGWKEHWVCEKCGAMYLDKDGKNLTTKKDITVVKAKAPEVPKTGDENNMLPIIGLMSLASLVFVLLKRRNLE